MAGMTDKELQLAELEAFKIKKDAKTDREKVKGLSAALPVLCSAASFVGKWALGMGALEVSYSKPEGKTTHELELELVEVWKEYYQPGEEHSDHITFSEMVDLFANDDFYNLHLVAKAYKLLPVDYMME